MTDLRSGTSIAEVAQAHNVAPSTVEAALVTAGDARVDKAAANHRLTADQAAKIKATLPAAVDKIVNHVFGQHTSAS